MQANTSREMRARLVVGLGALAAVLSACGGPQAHTQSNGRDTLATRKPALSGPALLSHPDRNANVQAVSKRAMGCCRMARPTRAQRALARTAARFVGARRIQANGQRFRYDCSGLARAVYFSQGIDLFDGVNAEGGRNGVRLIHQFVMKHGRLHQGPTARPGDLVFFHNTWDANGDGRVNDPWTHIGIVEHVEANGTVVFVSRVSRGVERYRINLRRPGHHRTADGPVLNDFMRKKRWRDSGKTRYLTGELFAAFGTLTH